MQVVVAFMATIQFPDTRLHERLELERGGIWFLEKEPSHWMIHYPKTRLHGTRSFKGVESLPTQTTSPISLVLSASS